MEMQNATVHAQYSALVICVMETMATAPKDVNMVAMDQNVNQTYRVRLFIYHDFYTFD